MILTLDAGNTNIVLGVYDGDKLMFTARIATQTALTADEYAVKIRDTVAMHRCNSCDLEGAAISSVVTPLTPAFKEAVKMLGMKKIVTVGPGIKTGVNIKIDDPAALGADLVCGAVGAMEKYDPPCVIFDLGTATTISAIDRNRFFLGGSIAPGIRVSLKALSGAAAALPDINTELSGNVLIGTNTVDSMKSGSIIGAACMMDGMAVRYKEAVGRDATVIATGGLAGTVLPYCRESFIHDDTLLLDGLYILYKKNC